MKVFYTFDVMNLHRPNIMRNARVLTLRVEMADELSQALGRVLKEWDDDTHLSMDKVEFNDHWVALSPHVYDVLRQEDVGGLPLYLG